MNRTLIRRVDDAKALSETITQLYAGLVRLFEEHAIPDAAGSYFLERSFIHFTGPIVDRYTYKHSVMQAFMSVHKLEKRNGTNTLPAQKYFKNVLVPDTQQFSDVSGRLVRGLTPTRASEALSTPKRMSARDAFKPIPSSHSAHKTVEGTPTRSASDESIKVTVSFPSNIAASGCVSLLEPGKIAAHAPQLRSPSSAPPLPATRRLHADKAATPLNSTPVREYGSGSTIKPAIDTDRPRRAEVASPGSPLRHSWAHQTAAVDKLLKSLGSQLQSPDFSNEQQSQAISESEIDSFERREGTDSGSCGVEAFSTTSRTADSSQQQQQQQQYRTLEPHHRTSLTMNLRTSMRGATNHSSATETVVAALCSVPQAAEERRGPKPSVEERLNAETLPPWAVTTDHMLRASILDPDTTEALLLALFQRYCLYGDRDKGSYASSSDEVTAYRMNMNQFAKLCADAGIIGRGGHGGGMVARGDIQVEFKAATARMCRTASEPASVKLWKQNSYTFREITRSMVNLGMDYVTFAHSLLQLARRRYCPPESVGASACSTVGLEGLPKILSSAKSVKRAREEIDFLERWNALHEASSMKGVSSEEVTPVMALRLLVLNQLLPLAIHLDLIETESAAFSTSAVAAWDAHEVNDQPVPSLGTLVAGGMVPHQTAPETEDFHDLLRSQGGYSATRQPAQNAMGDNSGFANSADDYVVDTAATRRLSDPENNTIDIVSGRIEEAQSDVHSVHEGLQVAISMLEDILQDDAYQVIQPEDVPVHEIVPEDMRLLHKDQVPRASPQASSKQYPAHAQTKYSVNPDRAALSSRAHFVNGLRTSAERPSRVLSTNIVGQSPNHVQTNVMSVSVGAPLGSSPHSTAKSPSGTLPGASPRIRGRSRRLEISQADLLPRTRSLTRHTPATKAQPTLITEAKTVEPHQQQHVAHHDLSHGRSPRSPPPRHRGEVPPVDSSTAQTVNAAVLAAVFTADKPASPHRRDSNASLSPDSLASGGDHFEARARHEVPSFDMGAEVTRSAEKHVSWTSDLVEILEPMANPVSTLSNDTWGPDSDGDRDRESEGRTDASLSPSSMRESVNVVSTPDAIPRPGIALPTTDRAQREWQRRFADGEDSEGSPSGHIVQQLPTNISISPNKVNNTEDIDTTAASILSDLRSVPAVDDHAMGGHYDVVRANIDAASPGAIFAVPRNMKVASSPSLQETSYRHEASRSGDEYRSQIASNLRDADTLIRLHVRPDGVEIVKGTNEPGFLNSTGPGPSQAPQMSTVVRFHRSGSFDIETQPHTAIEGVHTSTPFAKGQTPASALMARATPTSSVAGAALQLPSSAIAIDTTSRSRRHRSPHKGSLAPRMEATTPFVAPLTQKMATQTLFDNSHSLLAALPASPHDYNTDASSVHPPDSEDAESLHPPVSPLQFSVAETEHTEIAERTAGELVSTGQSNVAARLAHGSILPPAVMTGRMIPSQSPQRSTRLDRINTQGDKTQAGALDARMRPQVSAPQPLGLFPEAPRVQEAYVRGLQVRADPPSASARSTLAIRRTMKPTQRLVEAKKPQAVGRLALQPGTPMASPATIALPPSPED